MRAAGGEREKLEKKKEYGVNSVGEAPL